MFFTHYCPYCCSKYINTYKQLPDQVVIFFCRGTCVQFIARWVQHSPCSPFSIEHFQPALSRLRKALCAVHQPRVAPQHNRQQGRQFTVRPKDTYYFRSTSCSSEQVTLLRWYLRCSDVSIDNSDDRLIAAKYDYCNCCSTIPFPNTFVKRSAVQVYT